MFYDFINLVFVLCHVARYSVCRRGGGWMKLKSVKRPRVSVQEWLGFEPRCRHKNSNPIQTLFLSAPNAIIKPENKGVRGYICIFIYLRWIWLLLISLLWFLSFWCSTGNVRICFYLLTRICWNFSSYHLWWWCTTDQFSDWNWRGGLPPNYYAGVLISILRQAHALKYTFRANHRYSPPSYLFMKWLLLLLIDQFTGHLFNNYSE